MTGLRTVTAFCVPLSSQKLSLMPPDADPRTTSAADLAKDGKYFFEYGDWTFLVEDVLFKIPKFPLIKFSESSSMFSNMAVDANPDLRLEYIPLDDSAEDFRALCWAMYSSPTEMYAVWTTPTTVDVKTYLRIVNIAHKYLLTEYETWAWLMARKSGDAVSSHLDKCSEDELEHMLALAHRCEYSAPELLDLVETAWIRRIQSGQVSCEHALVAAETHNHRYLQAATYLHLRSQLVNGPNVPKPGGDLSYLGLSKTHLHRLLIGHAQMSHQYFDRKVALVWPEKPALAVIPRHDTCRYHPSCEMEWEKLKSEGNWIPDALKKLTISGRFPQATCVVLRLERLKRMGEVQHKARFFLEASVDKVAF
ncbi:hypothetical protein HMN09_00992300 [Mycena chlorophos]|uniref:BTB domain-containing protein n=1 Tax=Mycena chlorophos TaxID=658473 RepID=A0A8H6W309_MYCCL|nr:hypothetical protein HMN09_00992300 [Mycena chlorophos]